MEKVTDYCNLPDVHGRFGPYGGSYVAETLMAPLAALTENYLRLRGDAEFIAELDHDLKHYVGRPSPIYHAQRLSKKIGGAQILFKREDLNHTGAHKINNTVGQALVARHMGKTRIIAETGAGQHGVASATVAARLGLECVVYMGATDIERQKINVYRMQLLGATVVPVTSGSKTLKDALNEALRDWVTNVDDTFYIIGTVAGPHPYPMMVRDFNAVVGREARVQMLDEFGRLPDALVACVGGGSNAIGLFHAFSTIRAWRSTAPKRPVTALPAAVMRRRWPPDAPACCMATALTFCVTTTARSPKRIRFRRVWIIPASAPNMRSSRTPDVRSMPASPTTRRSPHSTSWRARKASWPRWNPATRSRMRSNSRGTWKRIN